MVSSADACPRELRQIFTFMNEQIALKFGKPAANSNDTNVVGVFFLLRCINPAIINPWYYQLVKGNNNNNYF